MEYGLHFFGYTEAEIIGQPVLGTIVPPFEETGRDLAEMIDDIVKHPDDYASNTNQNLRKMVNESGLPGPTEPFSANGETSPGFSIWEPASPHANK